MADHSERAPLGRRIIDHLALKDVGVAEATAQIRTAHKDAWLTGWLERFEREMAPFVGPLHEHLLANDELPPALRTLLTEAADPGHQIAGIIQTFIVLASLPFTLGSLAAPWIQNVLNTEWSQHTDIPLTPSELAVATIKGHIAQDAAASAAGMSGLNAERFNLLVAATGNPPGPETLLAMYRRNIIDGARLFDGIAQSNLRTEWVPDLINFATGPPSAAAAILGVVQNHLDEASARTILKENGIDDSYYPWLYANAGRPPGPMEMLGAWNRGLIAQSTVEQAIRESDVKDKYIPVLLGLREHLLPQKTIVAGVHQGVIPDDVALTDLLKLGISAQNAGYLIAEGHNNKVASHKTVSVSQIETAYQDGSITRAQAQAMLVALNYLAADADFILNLVDVKWQQSLHNATVSRVRALYVGHKIDRATAGTDLDAAGVSSAHRDLYLQQWDLVRATPTRTLTESQAATAYKRLIIGEAEFRSRLAALGYAADDVNVLVQLTPVKLTQAQVLKARATGVITDEQARARFRAMGLADTEIDVIFQSTPVIGTGTGA